MTTRSSKFKLAVALFMFTLICGFAGQASQASSPTATNSAAHVEPFEIVYQINEPNGAQYKRYLSSNGHGCFRSENEMPYSKVDGVTDVTIEDYNRHKRFVINTYFQAVEVYPLGDMRLPLSEKDIVRQLNASSIGQKKIAGFMCNGWRFGNSDEVWISPELNYYLEFRSNIAGGTVLCHATSAAHRQPRTQSFALPDRYKYVNANEIQHSHHHSD